MKDQKTFTSEGLKLLFRNSDVNKPLVLAQKVSKTEYALLVSFLADLTPEEEVKQRKEELTSLCDTDSSKKYFKEIRSNTLVAGEFTFLLDRS